MRSGDGRERGGRGEREERGKDGKEARCRAGVCKCYC